MSPGTPRVGTVLAFDFGLARIGVAVGETETGHAHPLTVIADEANAARFAAIEKLLAEWKPAGLVVGLPLRRLGVCTAGGWQGPGLIPLRARRP